MSNATARLGITFLVTVALTLSSTVAWAQQNGVKVDAAGVLRVHSVADPEGRLHRQLVAAARAALDQDLARRSEMRMVSLNRLEAAVGEALQNHGRPTDAMLNLAGLTRVRYVFYYPASKDIVLAGPAEGWATDATGRQVGIHTGRPILELQDLIVALRAYAPDAEPSPVISVSIDPTPEGLRNMQTFLSSLRGVTPRDIPQIATRLRAQLGLQDVVIHGVSPKTHFAQVLVEADYRMKLIGIGLEQTPVRLATYISKASPGAVARNALKRWYFVPDYQCVRVSDEGMAMQLVGDGVKLLGEDQLVAADGSRRAGGRFDRASEVFTRSFTEKYPQLAARSPVYAQMRNLIDLAVAAAFIRQQDFYTQAGWAMSLFADERAYPVETYPSPQQVETAVNVVWKGSVAMTPVGG
ncbi:MAG: DUF1598 domain-containing protein, partial [Planctomycetales bacterium]|nr:DUF1598 domain-containing protein [Planctomycetales bacterium]